MMCANFTTYVILLPQVTYDLLDTLKLQELKDDAVNGSEKEERIIRKHNIWLVAIGKVQDSSW